MMIRSRLHSLLLCALLTVGGHAQAEEPQHPDAMHSASEPSQARQPAGCTLGPVQGTPGFQGVQIETSDITLYERFFDVIRATLVRQFDHPNRDKLRGYCYRSIVIAVRQDLAVARPTGWVQLNFTVSDVAVVRRDIEQALESSALASLTETERARIIRFRLKPDVMRGGCRVIRFEVSGPEGFMIGFDQVHGAECRAESGSASDDSGLTSKP